MLTLPDRGIEKVIGRRASSFFRVSLIGGRPAVTIHRPGELPQIFRCGTLGEANQLRIQLAEGLPGLIEGAR